MASSVPFQCGLLTFSEQRETMTVETTSLSGANDMLGFVSATEFQRCDRNGDVVFLHGLGGDSRTTWHSPAGQFRPAWLARDDPHVAVSSLGYDVPPFSFLHARIPRVSCPEPGVKQARCPISPHRRRRRFAPIMFSPKSGPILHDSRAYVVLQFLGPLYQDIPTETFDYSWR